MHLSTADQSELQAAVRVDLGAIFVSLELSRSTWLVTSIVPGSEKMSRHMVAGGDSAGLLVCLTGLRSKAEARTGMLYPLVVIQEAGLDGFWIDRVLNREDWIESHIVECGIDRGVAPPPSRQDGSARWRGADPRPAGRQAG